MWILYRRAAGAPICPEPRFSLLTVVPVGEKLSDRDGSKEVEINESPERAGRQVIEFTLSDISGLIR